MNATSELESLRAEYSRMTTELTQIECECDYDNALSFHKTQTDLLCQLADEIEKIQAEYDRKVEEFQRLTDEDTIYTKSMKIAKARWYDRQADLVALRSKIFAIDAVHIHITRQGHIEISGGLEETPSDAGSDAIFDQLVTLTSCENLWLKRIRMLATVIAMLKHAGSNAKLTIDIPEVEVAYREFVKVTSFDESHVTKTT